MKHLKSISKNQRQAKEGFTLIELLTVIAIIAILSAILIPTVGQMRETAVKTADVSKLRQISSASLIFAKDNREKLVSDTNSVLSTGVITNTATGTDLIDVAATLAVAAGLNDVSAWTSDRDPIADLPTGAIVTKSNATPAVYTIDTNNNLLGRLSFDYVVNLNMSTPSTAPLAFTRQTTAGSSSWGTGDPYLGKGGHIVFVGGNVQWYGDLTGNLVDGGGNTVNDLTSSLTQLTGAAIYNNVVVEDTSGG